MKKIFVYLIFILFAISWQSKAQFSESFEGGMFPPVNWTVINDGDSNGWEASTTAHTGSRAAEINYLDTAHDDWLITPAISVVAHTTDRISFWAKNHSSTYLDQFNVLLSTTGTAKSDFTVVLDTNVPPPTTYTKYEYFLADYVGQTVYIAIQAISTDEYTLYVDDVVNDGMPSCVAPGNLSVLNTGADAVELSWTPGFNETNWNVEYGPAGYTQGNGTSVTVSGTPSYALNGLSVNTSYDFYVQANCGSNDVSNWVGPYNFTTACYISQFPYEYGFEDLTANTDANWTGSCWSDDRQNTGGGAYRWNPKTGETPSGDTGPANAHGGNIYAYAEASGSDEGDIAELLSPALDLSSLTQPQFSFYYHMYGADMGTLYVDTFDGTTWTEGVWSISGEQQSSTTEPWQRAFVSIANTTTRIRFRAIRGSGYKSDIAIDDITLDESPSCLAPDLLSVSNITEHTALLSWNETGSANTWNIEYGTTGFTPGSGTLISGISANPYRLTGLAPNTTYDYYVQSDCGGGDTSTWEGPYTFNIPLSCGTYRVELLGSSSSDNGWNGGRLTVYINGVAFLTNKTLYYGTTRISYDIPANLHDVLTFDYTPGSDNSENEYKVYDPDNILIADQGPYPGDIGDPSIPSGIIACQGCPEPSDLTAFNITTNSADLSWTNNGLMSTWNIEYGPAGFTQGNGTLISGVTNYDPYHLTGLTKGTIYEYYVQADCGGGDFSNWVGPYNFMTVCHITQFPYNYGFEDTTRNGISDWSNSCWSGNPEYEGANDITSLYRWIPDDAGGYSFNAGPENAHSGSMYASALISGSNGDSAELISPVMDMSSLTQPQFTFFYHMHGSDTGTLSVDTYDGITWTNDVWTITGEQQTANTDPWEEVNLYIPNTVTQIRFRAIRANGGYSRISVDDIRIREAPTCLEPTLLSASNITAFTADLSWTENNNATTWNIEYGPSGFTQGQGTVVSGVTSNPYTLSGLSPNTDYDYYVQTDCGGGDTSAWVGPFSFTTFVSCGIYQVKLSSIGGDWNGSTLSVYINGNIFLSNITLDSSDNNFGFYDIPVNQNDILSFDFTAGSWADRNSYNVYDQNGQLIAQEGENNTVPGDIGNPNMPTGIVACATCLAPSDLSADNITDDSADLSWTESGSATAWNIEYGPAGFTQGQGTTVNVSSTSYTLTGLSPKTSYDYYVQANCGGGDLSAWTGPYTFGTLGTCGAFRVDLLDSGNNGWGNADLAIYVNGTTFLNYVSLSSGTGPKSIYIPVNNDDILSFVYTSGNNSYENEYIVYDNNNNIVADEGENGTPRNIGDYHIPTGLEACPTCAIPTDLVATHITDTQIDFSWTAGSNETEWNIEYGPTGFTQGQGSTISTTSNSYSLTGLSPHTSYDIYVQANCNANGGNGTSRWLGPLSNTTVCSIAQFPYNYGFEDITSSTGGDWTTSCWSSIPEYKNISFYQGPFRWVTDSNGTSSSYTGPSNAHSGERYAYTVTWDSNIGDVANLISPRFDMSDLAQPQLSFYYHMFGADIGTLYVDTFDGINWTEGVWSASGQQQTSGADSWQQAFVPISNTVTQIRFRAVYGNGYRGNIALDDIAIQETPSCIPPNRLSAINKRINNVDLSWTENNSATTWNIEYGPAGFIQGSGIMLSGITTNPYHLSGLTSMTAYDFYVQTDCGSGNTSDWTGPYHFKTPPGCGDTFYDNGGPNYSYSANVNEIFTVYPNNQGDIVTVTFNNFFTEENSDFMFVYNGPDTNAPIIPSDSFDGSWTGGNFSALGHSFTATNPSGALTFRFASNDFLQYDGWEAVVSCGPSDVKELTNITGIYPNPSNGVFIIKSHDLNFADVFIYTITGKEIYHNTIDKDTYIVNLKGVQKGVYFVKIVSDEKYYVSKVIVK